MRQKILWKATACLLCVISVPILQYLNAKHGMSVYSKVVYQPLCKYFSHTSFHNMSTEVVSWESIENEIKNLEPGGHFAPKGCRSQWKVAIIVPYRNRENHLKVFLRNIHPFLQQQQLEYGIFVIEMPPGTPFNRGLLMNVGFKESCIQYNYNCFIFHDVDLLPETTRNVYNCNDHPKHLSSAVDTRKYKYVLSFWIIVLDKEIIALNRCVSFRNIRFFSLNNDRLPYGNYFGGVTAILKDQFTAINGFSNAYFGWGREDDDLYYRVVNANLTIRRLSSDIGRYKNLGHVHAILGAKKYI